jgi:Transcriptional regulation of mitochondrial recombination
MVFHGKKTVPATLRKDMWCPFYSVHFDDTKVGLRAFQLLREFSLQRQLAPPKELITITEKWLERKRPKDVIEAEKWDEENKKTKNAVGSIMGKKDRARALMDQKATSVADIAAVLAIQEEELKSGFASGERGYLTRKARQRRRLGRKLETEASERAATRVQEFEEQLQKLSVQVGLAGVTIEDPTGHNEYAVAPEQVKILWTDIYDAHYAKAWPERVSHGHLALHRDHVMPGQERGEAEESARGEGEDGEEILANANFAEKAPARN